MESGMLFQKEKWKMSQPTWKRWKRDRQTDRHPDEVFTFLWCVNVRLHSINHPLREAGRLHARCAEGKVAQAQLSDTVFYIHYQKFVSIFFFFYRHRWMHHNEYQLRKALLTNQKMHYFLLQPPNYISGYLHSEGDGIFQSVQRQGPLWLNVLYLKSSCWHFEPLTAWLERKKKKIHNGA